MSALPVEEWQDKAACRGPQSSLFFPPPRTEPRDEKIEREALAKSICNQCSVVTDCLTHALDVGEVHGIWGGRNEIERRNLLLRRANGS